MGEAPTDLVCIARPFGWPAVGLQVQIPERNHRYRHSLAVSILTDFASWHDSIGVPSEGIRSHVQIVSGPPVFSLFYSAICAP